MVSVIISSPAAFRFSSISWMSNTVSLFPAYVSPSPEKMLRDPVVYISRERAVSAASGSFCLSSSSLRCVRVGAHPVFAQSRYTFLTHLSITDLCLGPGGLFSILSTSDWISSDFITMSELSYAPGSIYIGLSLTPLLADMVTVSPC